MVPFGSKKKAPVVSPAHSGLASAPMMPAICSPELNTYWSAVPLGQNPPPMVDELVESTQTSPVVARPHSTRLTVSAPSDRANSLNPWVFPTPGFGFTAAAVAVDGETAATARAKRPVNSRFL